MTSRLAIAQNIPYRCVVYQAGRLCASNVSVKGLCLPYSMQGWWQMVDPQLGGCCCDLRRKIRSHAAHLVLDPNLDLLLGRGDDVVLSSTLEVRKLVHSRLDDLKRLLDLGLSDHQRGCKTNDVLVGGLGLEKRIRCWVRPRGMGHIWIHTSKPFSFINMQRSQAE